ncbi:MAG TPA: ParB N-terminal domain-containing protein, partial [Candidatus Thermoplasmatota archaeon]|nr:ParB N-terminal domain-containing protein [Candidatus Thermoplasmatota archaeon]
PVERLLAHEQTVQKRVDDLVKVLQRERRIRLAIVADARTMVVLDGHHRLAALRVLGCKRVPVLLVDYARPDIRVGTWREGEQPPTKDDVVKHASQGKLYPPKSTRHFFPWKLAEEPVPLDDLLRAEPAS